MTQETKVQSSISQFFKSQSSNQKLKKDDVDNSNNIIDLTNADEKVPSRLANFEHKPDKISKSPNELDKHKRKSSIDNDNVDEVPKPTTKKPKTGQLTSRTKSKSQSAGSSNKKLTPLEKQFIEMKRSNLDKVLAIQVGYKFKFFGEDAVVVSQILSIMLIPGNIKLDDSQHDRFAYCSIPDNRLHIHLKRLLNQGLKVGVVKQTETAAIKSVDSNNKSGLFERKITGVYTKATYMGDELLTGDPNINRTSVTDDEMGDYIFCIDELHSKDIGMIAIQPITGDIIYDAFKDNVTRDELETRLIYLNPSEIIVINDNSEISKETLKMINIVNDKVNIIHKPRRSQTKYTNEIYNFFSTIDEGKYKDLGEQYLLKFPNNIQSCMIELIQYLEEFKLSNIFTIISNVSCFSNSKTCLVLPSSTVQALEIFQNTTDANSNKGSLIWLLNHTRTRMGNRLLVKWISKPLIDKDQIEERLQAIEDLTFKFNHFIDSLKNQLDKIGKASIDLEKNLIKVHYSSTYQLDKISRKEVYLLLKCFDDILTMIKHFENPTNNQFESIHSPLLLRIFDELIKLSKEDTVKNLLDMISADALDDSNLNDQKIKFFNLKYFKDQQIIDQLSEILKVESLLNDELTEIRKMLKRPQLNYITNSKETYLIEVRNGKMVDSLPKDWIKINGTKTVSRFRSTEITRLHKQLQYHNDMLIRNCDNAFNSYLFKIDNNYDFFSKVIRNLSIFDCLLSLSAVSSINSNYSRPKIVEDKQIIQMKNSRNPIIENLSVNYSNYISNDINISYDEDRVLIITGPNMGGKSTYVKQVALLVIMAQIGSYIPCDEATVGIFDSIFIRMGARDNILQNQSTFMVEMLECSHILKNMTSNSLIILDEIGRGTGTNDGIAIAYSILNYLIEEPKKPLTLFITHFPSLHVLEDKFKGIVANYHMGFHEVSKSNQEFPEVVFLYNLVRGVVGNLYGLNVAKLAGIPDSIINSAYIKSTELRDAIEADWPKKLIKIIKLLRETNDSEIDLLEIEQLCNNID
ncbi:DNA mismatch repair protein MSH3 [Debaryomyces fabryi]|uniref:DNA mismatch repair protein MSH3 n=1 Tax=Debaryomyces fabryi TaxID=58627 RepID=A0A0V1PU38_9ASCO|nr:DNA mismatch repair protein MSH3 [Debaryomyces fabryi]KRZ99779.1 DNA mismatch repair protein MSH3 [Debaryomyces fabryi]CUM57253.1 unnamed protein product [Debaryomyces fabryi]